MSSDDREERKSWNRSDGSRSAEKEAQPQENLSPLQDEIESKKKEYNDLYDKYLRVVADFDNYKKRVEKEKVEIIAYGNEELIKELLPVLDGLERALEHSKSNKGNGQIAEGIKLVYKQFLSRLKKFGVEPIEATKGEKFDPKYHQAIEYVESNKIAPGLILSEKLKGYMFKDRLLRPSLVVVSKEGASA